MSRHFILMVGASVLLALSIITTTCRKNEQPNENCLPPADSLKVKRTTISGIKMLTVLGTNDEQGPRNVAIFSEFDGMVIVANGLMTPVPDTNDQFLMDTNYFRLRQPTLNNSWRYYLLSDMMMDVRTSIHPQ